MISPATTISLCTVRLHCIAGQNSSVGTGFLYNFDVSADRGNGMEQIQWPMIITNKHVVENMDKLEATFTLAPKGSVISDIVVGPNDTHARLHMENLKASTIHHPDPDIDVCAVPINYLLSQIPEHLMSRHTFVDRSWHLTPDEVAVMRPMEPIVMIGYPNGLWDEAGNRPITRRGLTASHPILPWNGRRQFVIDAASFPGSSGSPVFLYEDGMFRISNDSYAAGCRARLLGLLFAGPTLTREGRIEQRAIPTAITAVPVMDVMMNLGYVAHVETLNDFVPLIEQRLAANRLTWKD